MKKIYGLLLGTIMMLFSFQGIFATEGDIADEAVNQSKGELLGIVDFTANVDLNNPQPCFKDIVFTCIADGDEFVYKYTVLKDGYYYAASGETLNDHFRWTPSEPGYYQINVTAYDLYMTASRNLIVTVELFNPDLVEGGEYIEYTNDALLEDRVIVQETVEASDPIDVFKIIPEDTGKYYLYVSDPMTKVYIYDENLKMIKGDEARDSDANRLDNLYLIGGKDYYAVVRDTLTFKESSMSIIYRIHYGRDKQLMLDKDSGQPIGTTVRFEYYDKGLDSYNYKVYDAENNENVLLEQVNMSNPYFEYTFNDQGYYYGEISAGDESSSDMLFIYDPSGDEVGDTFETARVIRYGSYNSSLEHVLDIDYYKFTAPLTGEYRIYSSGGFKLYGSIYDSDKKGVYSKINSVDNSNFDRIVYLEKDQEYYIKVIGQLNEGMADTYTIHVEGNDLIDISPDSGMILNIINLQDVTVTSPIVLKGLEYEFVIEKDKKLIFKQNRGKKSSCQFTPNAIGTYEITCHVYTSLGTKTTFKQPYYVTALTDVNEGQGFSSTGTISDGDTISAEINGNYDIDYYRFSAYLLEDAYVWIERDQSLSDLKIEVYYVDGRPYSGESGGVYSGSRPLKLPPLVGGYILKVLGGEGAYTLRCEQMGITLKKRSNYPVIYYNSNVYKKGELLSWECNRIEQGTVYNHKLVGGYSTIFENSGTILRGVDGIELTESKAHRITIDITPNGRSSYTIEKEVYVVEEEDLHGNSKAEAQKIEDNGQVYIIDAYHRRDDDWLRLDPRYDGTHYFNVSADLFGDSFSVNVNIFAQSQVLIDSMNYSSDEKNISSKTLTLDLNAYNYYYVQFDWENVGVYTKLYFEVTDVVHKEHTDINGNGILDIWELNILKSYYGYDDVCYYDDNGDVVIDILDIVEGMKRTE